jgi:hypothetical protein
MIRLVLIARLVSAPLPRVELVAAAAELAGNDVDITISRVAWESGWDPCMERVCFDGSTDWGLAQFNSRYHDQHRDDLRAHVRAMEAFAALCNRRAAGDPRLGLAIYHRWIPDALGLRYAERVMAIYAIVADQVIDAFNAPTRAGGVAIAVAYNTGRGGARDKGSRTARREPDEVYAILSKRLGWLPSPAGRSLFGGVVYRNDTPARAACRKSTSKEQTSRPEGAGSSPAASMNPIARWSLVMKAWIRDRGVRNLNRPAPNSKGHDEGKLSQTWQAGTRRPLFRMAS